LRVDPFAIAVALVGAGFFASGIYQLRGSRLAQVVEVRHYLGARGWVRCLQAVLLLAVVLSPHPWTHVLTIALALSFLAWTVADVPLRIRLGRATET